MRKIMKRTRNVNQLEEINTCRTWLQVHYLSDIAVIDGSRIHPGYLKGRKVHESQWSWPRWIPPVKSWERWRAVLRSYVEQLFPIRRRPFGHQKTLA